MTGHDLLRRAMAERALTQSAVAALIGRKQASVSRWLDERKPALPDARAMVALEVHLGIPLAAWICDERAA